MSDEATQAAPGQLTATASLSAKLNLGNYESADVFLSISGITAETTEEEVDELLAKGAKLAWDRLKVHLGERTIEVRDDAKRRFFGGGR